jgi:glycosyltransferase involved in cell wall biosynthesis
VEEHTEKIGLKPQQYVGGGNVPGASDPIFDSKLGPDYLKTKRGVAICVITRGTIPIKWMMHMNQIIKFSPGGLFWKYIVVERLSWAAARNEAIRKARAANFKYAFFVDDDVFIPDDALDLLLRSGKDIISGIYWTKTENAAPVIFEDMGSGPMYQFPIDKIIPIGGSGLGCCLINLEVFDKFDEAGAPYFVENWIYTAPDGQKLKCPIGEDHYFFIKAKEFGYQPYAHTGILCDHYNWETDTFYPGEKVVKDLNFQKLAQEGREDVISAVKKQDYDPTKKTVVFYNAGAMFAGDEIERRGVGGSEADIIYLAREFQRQGKYNVRVYCDCTRPGSYDGVRYRINRLMVGELKDLPKIDLFIASRETAFLRSIPDFKERFKINQFVLWGHDMAEDPHWENFPEIASKFDAVVMLTESHRDDLIKRFPGVDANFKVIGDAVDPALYRGKQAEKVKGKCIYSSTPYRGLDVLLEIWPRIKKEVPHAELFVFSSIKTYGEHFDDSPWESIYSGCKSTEGIKYHGSVPKARLAKEQLESELMLYPNTFKETFCITVAEAQMAGTPIITTKLGALPETIKQGCGVLINADPYSKAYKDEFVKATIGLLKSPSGLETMRKECLKQDFGWDTRIKEWISNFLEGEPIPPGPASPPNPDTNPERDKRFRLALAAKDFGYNIIKFGLFKEFAKPTSGQHRILIVNCGLGELSRALKEAYPNAEVWATEESMFALDYCRQSNKKIFFANHPIANPEFERNYFSSIFVALEPGFSHPEQLLSLLAAGGQLIATIPASFSEDDVVNMFKNHPVVFYGIFDGDRLFSVR